MVHLPVGEREGGEKVVVHWTTEDARETHPPHHFEVVAHEHTDQDVRDAQPSVDTVPMVG